MSAVIEALEKDRIAAVKERDEARAEVERLREENANLRAEVERLRAERDTARAIASANGHADLVVQRDRACAEVERLRGLIAEAEWVSGGYIMGPPSCPWCSYPVKEEGHSEKCPAFSARGEVRR